MQCKNAPGLTISLIESMAMIKSLQEQFKYQKYMFKDNSQ